MRPLIYDHIREFTWVNLKKKTILRIEKIYLEIVKALLLYLVIYFCAIIRLTQMKRNIETKRRKLKVSRCQTGDY